MYSNKLAHVMYSQLLLFCFIFIIMRMFTDTNNPYFNMGPSDDLYVLAINVIESLFYPLLSYYCYIYYY